MCEGDCGYVGSYDFVGVWPRRTGVLVGGVISGFSPDTSTEMRRQDNLHDQADLD